MTYLNLKVENFSAGQLSEHLSNWKCITSDQSILESIAGEKIEFDTVPPLQMVLPQNSVSKEHKEKVDIEIKSLLQKGVVVKSEHEHGEFISPVFSVPKSDGNVRLILNLKEFNKYVKYVHFKMETIHSILKLVTPGCWMASIDLKDAYYSVKIHPSHQKFLKFRYNDILYKYTAYANGLGSCPRKFTKLIKPVVSELHVKRHVVAGYIDDFILLNETYEGCAATVAETIITFDKLGFVVHPQKSVFIPNQSLVFLGFVINSVTMKISLTDNKKEKMKHHLAYSLQNSSNLSVEYVARIIGYMISSLPAVQFGRLYCRNIEQDKIQALKISKGNYKANMSLSCESKVEVKWWLDNVDTAYNVIGHSPIDFTVYSDASLKGWGAALNDVSCGGQWSSEEAKNHINYLELSAALFALQCFVDEISNSHVKIMIDNTSAVGMINKMGSAKSDSCNKLVFKIWQFCIKNNIWLTAAHIPGCNNVVADWESRNFSKQDMEWMLDPNILKSSLSDLQFKPDIDLFASRLNNQFDVYCSFKPDPGAAHVDAFSISWSNLDFYCFPPFSCILSVLQKIKQEKATGVVVVPQWPTQSWYPVLMSMLCKPPVLLYPGPHLLKIPVFPEKLHPCHKKMYLLICLLSGNNLKVMDIHQKP